MVTRATREEMIAALAAIERALDDRLVIVREILAPSGAVVATYRRTVFLRRDWQTRGRSNY